MSAKAQGISQILGVPIPFFFDGVARIPGLSGRRGPAPTPGYVSEFLSSSGGLKLVRAFTQIGSTTLKRSVVRLVEEMAGDSER
jgi:hypothetical protein